MKAELKRKTISGLFWSMGEKVLTQAFSFVIGIVLARITAPEDYGYIIIASSFIELAQSLVETNLGDAYIQKKDADEEHASSLLFFMLGISSAIYLLLLFLAPLCALFYKIPELTLIIRVYGLALPITAIRSILMAIMQKTLRFKIYFYSSLSGTIIGGIVGIIAAYNGLGVWALVAFFILDTLMDTIVMAVMLKWKPLFKFSKTKIKELFGYAAFSFTRNMINQYSNQLVTLLIGKRYSSAELAYYNRGKQYPYVMSKTVNTVLASSMFPVLSKLSDDDEQFLSALRRLLKVTTFLQLPILFGLASVARPLVSIVLTDKWIMCVPFLQIVCVSFSFWPYTMGCRRALEAKGFVKRVLKNETIVTFFRLTLCLGALFISPLAVTIAELMVWTIDLLISSHAVKSKLGYNIIDQIKDVLPNYLCSALMVIAVIGIGSIINNILLKLCMQIIVGIVVYILLAIITKNDSMRYVLNIINKRI